MDTRGTGAADRGRAGEGVRKRCGANAPRGCRCGRRWGWLSALNFRVSGVSAYRRPSIADLLTLRTQARPHRPTLSQAAYSRPSLTDTARRLRDRKLTHERQGTLVHMREGQQAGIHPEVNKFPRRRAAPFAAPCNTSSSAARRPDRPLPATPPRSSAHRGRADVDRCPAPKHLPLHLVVVSDREAATAASWQSAAARTSVVRCATRTARRDGDTAGTRWRHRPRRSRWKTRPRTCWVRMREAAACAASPA